MSHSPEDLYLELQRLGRFFDLRFHLMIKPLKAPEVRGLASFVLLPHFLLQGALEEEASWRNWLAVEAAAVRTSLLFIPHFGWGHLVCSLKRDGHGLRTFTLERKTLDRKIGRSPAGRYISTVLLPYLGEHGYPATTSWGRISEVSSDRGRLESYCDKFDEKLALRELRPECVDFEPLLSLLFSQLETPDIAHVAIKSDADTIERWLERGCCRESPELDPLLGYESELGSGQSDIAFESVPALLGMAVDNWPDRSFNLNALLMRHGSSASHQAVGLFQITNTAGGLEGKLVLLEEPEASEAEVLRKVGVPVQGYQKD